MLVNAEVQTGAQASLGSAPNRRRDHDALGLVLALPHDTAPLRLPTKHCCRQKELGRVPHVSMNMPTGLHSTPARRPTPPRPLLHPRLSPRPQDSP